MSDRNVPVSLAYPNANVYNAVKWESLRNSVANGQFTPVEIKAFYVIGLFLRYAPVLTVC